MMRTVDKLNVVGCTAQAIIPSDAPLMEALSRFCSSEYVTNGHKREGCHQNVTKLTFWSHALVVHSFV